MINIEDERKTVEFMIKYYCKKKHKQNQLCPQCRDLFEYSGKRVAACRYGNKKPVCAECATHCFVKEKRESIKTVMRFVGPKMILINPKLGIKHIVHKYVKRNCG
jgi:hypothetical protein